MYSQDKINTVLQVHDQCRSVTETCRVLGYPTRRTLYIWIENKNVPNSPRKELANINTSQHPRTPLRMGTLQHRLLKSINYKGRCRICRWKLIC